MFGGRELLRKLAAGYQSLVVVWVFGSLRGEDKFSTIKSQSMPQVKVGIECVPSLNVDLSLVVFT